MAEDRIPTGRFSRLARVGAAAAGQAARQAGTRAANVGRSEEQRQIALERRQLEAAEQIVTVLGGMKGAAMKIGQVLSFVDIGIVPAEHRERFQAKLAKLRDAAPAFSFDGMRNVIESDLERPLADAFGEFDPEPIAAASIGQVYRATLHDGREVAVKVQYPGINDAVRADMQNLGILLRLARTITPELDTKAVGDEIRERIVEELDYELEASNQRTMARLYDGHPFIHVPPVVSSLCRERVIVSEYVAGDRFDALRGEPDAERDRIGEIIFRFYFGSMYRHRRFSGDPHPGNMIRLGDGRIAFLDFGLFKTIDAPVAALELACQRATVEGDAAELHRLMSGAGFLPRADRLDAQELLAFVRDGIWWYTTDEPVLIDQDVVNRAFIETTDPRSSHYDTVRHQDIVPEHLFGRRLELLTLAVLGQLEAEANWHRIAREWMYDEDPVTELGRQEAEFWARAGLRSSNGPGGTPAQRAVAASSSVSSASGTSRTSRPSSRANASRTVAANASRSCSAPSSRLSDVIRAASIPQGTIHSNGCRSLLTLIAIPWVETPRLTWMPIEPILRASPSAAASSGSCASTMVPCGPSAPTGIGGAPAVQTPVRPSKICAPTPCVGEGGDHHPLEQADEGVDVGLAAPAGAREVDDRIGDELAGAVVGDPAAAVRLGDLDALHPVPVLAHAELARVGAAALGEDGRVLEQEQDVVDQAGLAGSGDRALQLERVRVGDDAEARAEKRGAAHPRESVTPGSPARASRRAVHFSVDVQSPDLIVIVPAMRLAFVQRPFQVTRISMSSRVVLSRILKRAVEETGTVSATSGSSWLSHSPTSG